MSVLGFDMETSSQELIMEARRQIIRGKRTKRPRPSTTTTTSSSSSGGERCLENDGYFSMFSPQSCENSASTEEDEDMANCLILLAQSGSSFNPKQDHNDEINAKKFPSRKFNEISTSMPTKTEFDAYECKTCNRSFPSFQALGGHRASHKKPKNTIEEKKVPIAIISNDKEDQEFQFKKMSPSTSPQKAKVHECSICGSEFSSGQALGGHMRRHRIPTTNINATMSSIMNQDDQKPRNHVLLDLNLPAPEDDHFDSKFQFVFTAPALVDCHY